MYIRTEVDEREAIEAVVKANKSAERSKSGDIMVERSNVKITVLKKTDSKQIFSDNPPLGQAIEACSRFKEGQEFIVGEDGKIPEGFCQWAWNDLFKVGNYIEVRGKLSLDERERNLYILLHRRTETCNLRT